MIDQSNRAGKMNSLQSTDIYTYSHNTRDMYNIVPPVLAISHGYIYSPYHSFNSYE